MGQFRIQLLLEDNSWSTIYIIPKNNQISSGWTQWHLFDLVITQQNFGIKFMHDQILTTHSDMCFSNIILFQSVY